MVALVLCFGPIVAVDERRLVRTSATLPMRTALATTLRNRPFLAYLGAQILFAFGITMIGPMAPYYVLATALLSWLFVALGNSSDRATGVLLVGPIAGAFCLAAACVYALYPERRVLAERMALEREDAAG